MLILRDVNLNCEANTKCSVRSSHKPADIHKSFTNQVTFYCSLPAMLREGNNLSRVFLSFCSTWRGGPHVTTNHNAIGQSQVIWEPSPQLWSWIPRPRPDMLKLVHLDLTIQGDPPSPSRTGCKAGGWPLTDRPSCFNVILYYILSAGQFAGIILQSPRT